MYKSIYLLKIVIFHSLLLNMAIEIVSFPIKNGDFPISFLLTFTRPGTHKVQAAESSFFTCESICATSCRIGVKP